jgi:hypothetical protein
MTDPAEAPSSSRITTILDPAFADALEGLPIEEIRRRRDEALAEREFQSYLRRLIQVRQALLNAERTRRSAGADQEPLMERLTSVLSEGPKGGRARGEAIRVSLSQADIDEAERQLDAVLGEAALASPEDLADAPLEVTLESLVEAERRVSADRVAVMRVHDRLQEEIKSRYREDPGQIPRQF